MNRPKKDNYYLNIASSIGERSPCKRRKFGSIIVKNDVIVATGYNGPPRGSTNCEDGCLKDEANAPRYARYDLCPAVHSEENAVVNAARHGIQIKDGTLYIVGKNGKTGEYTVSRPCDRCKRVLVNAGIKEVITKNKEGKIIRYSPEEWAAEEKEEYIKKLKKAREGKLK